MLSRNQVSFLTFIHHHYLVIECDAHNVSHYTSWLMQSPLVKLMQEVFIVSGM